MNQNHTPSGTTIFLHIPKAAGSTLTAIIQRQYRSEEMIKSYELMFAAATHEKLSSLESARFRYTYVKTMAPEKLAQVKVLMGHEGFGFHNLFSSPTKYITMLREPVERVISHYYYVLSHPKNRLYDPVHSQNMDLADFVHSGLSVEVDNSQTKYLAGLETPYLAYGEYGDELLAQAQKNLQQYFAVVGLTERFDASLLLLKRQLGWQMPFYTRVNVSRNRPPKKQISPSIVEQIKEYNRLDLELYQFAKRLFEEQVQQQGPHFARELKLFQTLNKLYGRYHYVHRAVSCHMKKLSPFTGQA